MPSFAQKCGAEFLGTFVLVFCACGCAGGTDDQTAIALSFGLSIVAMAYAIGNISGCHINPAVSLAFLILGQLTATEFIGYVISQFIGGFVGALCVFGFIYMSLKGNRSNRMGTYGFGGAANNILLYREYGYEAGSVFGGLLTEIVLTFIFVYVIVSVTAPGNSSGNLSGLIIGGALTLVHLVGIPITGTSVNPARSFATAITQVIYFDVHRSIEQIWIWILGPMIGGFLAPIVYRLLNQETTTVNPVNLSSKPGDNSRQVATKLELTSYNKTNGDI